MAQPLCPKCQTELTEEFGMVTCPGCGSVIFIDYEGQAQLAAEEEASPQPESNPEPSAQTPFENLGQENLADNYLGEPSFGEPAFDNTPPEKQESEAFDDALIESFANYESMTPMGAEIAVEAGADGVFEAAEVDAPAPSAPAQKSQIETDDGPLDISEYANSEASQAKEGPLTYTVHIEGLDSKELRESLREALGESRFAWDPGALMATIREGKLLLKAVEPVKASVLVNRLKRLPLKIWWEQNVVTDSKT